MNATIIKHQFSDFIKGLLHNIGTHVDPIILIERIREKMEIPGLRDSLVKILQDYNLQVTEIIQCFSDIPLLKSHRTVIYRQNL